MFPMTLLCHRTVSAIFLTWSGQLSMSVFRLLMMPQHFVRCPAVRGSHSFNSQHRDESWRTFLLPPLLPVFYCTGRLKLEKISFFSDMCCFYAAVYLYRIYIQIPAKFFYFLSFLKEIFFCFTLENMFVPITL